MDISMKLGFLGFGMGGCSIADECASVRMPVKNNMNPYTAFLINTNEVDLRKLPDRPNAIKYVLRGYERGAGRDIRIGEEAFLRHKDDIVKRMRDFFADRDFLFVVCGLGGGTGTGAVIEAVRMIHANGFAGRFGLILTLPRDQEGYQVLDNALQRLQVIARAMRGLGSIVLVDNQKLFDAYLQENPGGSVSSYLDHSNRYIAQTLHDLNVVTASYNPLSGYHFDGSELLKMFQTSGVLTFGKCAMDESAVDAENQGTYMPKIKQAVEEGILSDGYDFTEAARCAVSLVASPQGAKRIFTLGMVNEVEQLLTTLAPYAGERPVATYAGDIRQLHVYTIFAGLGLPKRIAALVEAAKQYDRPAKGGDILNALGGYQSQFRHENVDLESLLLDTPEQKKKTSKNSDDPFDF